MKTKSRKITSMLIALALTLGLFAAMPMKASAAGDIEVPITQIMTVAQIETAIQNAINDVTDYDTITVTGSKPDADSEMDLVIPIGKTVVWKATYIAPTNFRDPLIYLDGSSGIFEVATNGQITGDDTVIDMGSSDATVKITGGTINAANGYGVYGSNPASSITVSSGTVRVTTNNSAIGGASQIAVSGGTVSATMGNAIWAGSGASVTISGTAQVNATTGIAIYGGDMTINGGTVSATTGKAINSTGTVTISGGTISATTGTAIEASGTVTVNTGPVIISNDGGATPAINLTGTGSAVEVSSGTLTVSGNVTSSVDNGVVAYVGARVTVHGNINAYLDGVYVENGAEVTVNGTISSTTAYYINIDGTPYAEGGYSPTTTKTGYRTYSDTVSTVWVRIPTYTLTVSSGTGGGSYAAGTAVSITANAAPAGQIFDKWTTTSSGTFANENNATTTFNMPASNATVTATYKSDGSGGGSTGGGGSSTTNASITPTKTDFDKNDGKDIDVTLSKGSYTLQNLKYGSYTLKSGTDYTVSGNTYTIKADYLKTLATGSHTLTFNMSGGTSPKFTVTVKDTTPLKITNPFKDVASSAWYYDAVMYVYEKGLMIGTADDTFGVNTNLTRGMIVTILYRHAGEPSVAGLSNPFDDVAEGQWYSNAIKWAYANGIVAGYGNGKFGPNDALTNEQLATLIHRTQQSDKKIPPNAGGKTISDADKVSGWAKEFVSDLNKQGIFDDIPGAAFNPQSPASRAEIASMLYKWLTAVEK